MRTVFFKPLVTSLCLLPLLTYAEKTTQIATITDAEVIERIAPKYPITAVKKGREGWAILSFVIDKEGNVSDIVADDFAGDKRFVSASIAAMKKWKYSPAIENGKPVEQCKNSVQMDFRLSDHSDTNKVSRKFYRIYKAAQQAFAQNDLEKAKEYIDTIDTLKNLRFSDVVYGELLKAEYAKRLGDKKAQFRYLVKASAGSSSVFPDNIVYNLSVERLQLAIELNLLDSALSSLNYIMKLKKAQPELAYYQDLEQKIKAFIQSDNDLIVEGELNDNYSWRYPLVRHQFSIVPISGEIDKLDIRCANKRHLFTIGDEKTWSIPKKWQKCSVFVYGDKKATFTLIEHGLTENQVTQTPAD